MAKRGASKKVGKPAAKQKAEKTANRKAKPQLAEPLAYTVFISHSSKEKWIAGQIAKEIEKLGAKTWLDVNDLHGGDEIRRSIKLGIRASREAVLLLSVNSVSSHWVIYEAAIADGHGKRVTSILNGLMPEDVPAPLQGVKAVDLNDFDSFLVELAGRIKSRHDKSGKAVS